MSTDLQMWVPPARTEIDKAQQYQTVREQQNSLEITDLVAEHRDRIMRQQLDVSSKFMNVISDHVETVEDIESKKEQRATLRSLAETMKVVSDVQARAAMFDHVAKPKQQEAGNGRISLFVNCSPVGVAPRDAIDVSAV